MKKLPMILLLTAPYVLLLGFFGSISADSDGPALAGLAYFLLCLLCGMVHAFAMPRLGFTARQILLWNMVLKLSFIPFYAIVFLIVLVTNVMLIPALPFVLFVEYLLLLSSGMYGISGLKCAYQRGSVSKGFLVVNIAAHLCFCLDVVSAVFCCRKLKKSV